MRGRAILVPLGVTGAIRGLHRKKSCIPCKRNIFVIEGSGPGDKMKSAAKRAASEALMQILAVTAVLVFAEFIFYSRKLELANHLHSAF
jgi:hypothetical protein